MSVCVGMCVCCFEKKDTRSTSRLPSPHSRSVHTDCRNRLNVEYARACTHFDLHGVKERGSLRLKAPHCLSLVRFLDKEPGK